eukprot:TRINITY_DN5085_c0_g1_i1.p1 TRINITY_DN5085_c0_g1~~TRINITY_DN5085_c0_g1_i1.p1  ORF type:complete len:166 (+),score=40.07 TRINITY_DN5085_c0_g1_i1:83-580(+)
MATSLSLPFTYLVTSKSLFSSQTCNCKPPLPILSTAILPPPKKTLLGPFPTHQISQRKTQIWKIPATPDVLPSNIPVEETQQIVTTDESNGYPIISVLLFIAFIGLTILTIGVIYIAVTDFLQKREREKFEKEEAAKKKKGGKKGKVRAKTGPRGFGQKIEEDDD